MSDTETILAFLQRKAETGHRIALVTIVSVDGSSMRRPGTHLGVADDGEWRGSLSGGCVEAAVVAEALGAIDDAQPREVRFGAGSPFIDIRLPCGGAIDLLINPIVDPATLAAASERLAARQAVTITLPRKEGSIEVQVGADTEGIASDTDHVRVSHVPRLALVIVGDGANVIALSRLATAYGAAVRVLTPDERIAAAVRAEGGVPVILKAPSSRPSLMADRWTAITFLFHDHDWDIALLPAALESDAFYVGAMGSRATAARRRRDLAAAGLDAALIDRLHAPIGIIHSTRDPEALALSTLAAVVEAFNRERTTPA